jgi:hypothetical protein
MRILPGMVAHSYNPSYLGGTGWEDHGLKPTMGKELARPLIFINKTDVMVGCAWLQQCERPQVGGA